MANLEIYHVLRAWTGLDSVARQQASSWRGSALRVQVCGSQSSKSSLPPAAKYDRSRAEKLEHLAGHKAGEAGRTFVNSAESLMRHRFL